MKNIKGFLFLLLLTFSFCLAGDKTNKTFFLPRSQNVNLGMQMPRWLSLIYEDKKDHFGSSIQITNFYQDSTNGKDLSKYFMFDGKRSLKIGGANQDIHPYNFNLRSDYEGTISFDPEQDTYGIRLDYYQNFSKLINGFYYAIATSVVKVENKPGFKETITNQGLPHIGPNTAKETFAGHMLTSDWSDRWIYGKIEGNKHETGLADIDAKVGYRIFEQNRIKLSINLDLTMPTGNKTTGIYFFDPIVGNNRHWALGAGFDSVFKLWESNDKEKNFSLIVCADYRYLFENKQFRALELKNKKWARYIRMRQQDPSDATRVLGNSIPGINVMTRKVKVEPGSQLDFLADLQFKYKYFHFDIGYNLWAKESEDISLNNAWNAPGMFGLVAADSSFNNNIAVKAATPNFAAASNFPQLIYPQTIATAVSSETTINNYAAANGNLIQENDVDVSGSPSAMSHKILGNASFDFSFKSKPMFLGVGGSYEFASDNTALEQWALWLKMGVSM